MCCDWWLRAYFLSRHLFVILFYQPFILYTSWFATDSSVCFDFMGCAYPENGGSKHIRNGSLSMSPWGSTWNESFLLIPIVMWGRDSSVGIATRYGLDGPGIESRWWGEIFRTGPDRPWGPPSLLYIGYRVFTGGKAAGAWHWPPTPLSAEFKERVQLYLYSPSGSSCPGIGRNLTFNIYI